MAANLIVLFLLSTSVPGQSTDDANRQTTNESPANFSPTTTENEVDPGYCPIRPEEPASAEIYADYNGRRFYFCCESCRQDFLSDPSRFHSLTLQQESEEDGDSASAVDSLPQYQGGKTPFERSFFGRIISVYLAVEGWAVAAANYLYLDRIPNAIVAGLSFAWFGYLIVWSLKSVFRRRRRSDADSDSNFDSNFDSSANRLTSLRSPIVIVLTALLVAVYFYSSRADIDRVNAQDELAKADQELDRLQAAQQAETDQDNLHYLTIKNYGNPAVPHPRGLPNSLQKVYYRGNDERSEKMFNGGNYLTVTFELSLRSSDGESLDYGVKVAEDAPVILHIKMTRANSTSSGYYQPNYMKRFFLTQTFAKSLGVDLKADDVVAWQEVDEQEVWEADFPIHFGKTAGESDRLDAEPPESDQFRSDKNHGEIVYLCETRYDGERLLGARYHYGVVVDFDVQDGEISSESNLWMGTLYRGRNFGAFHITPDEWLSTQPLPEKPDDT